MRHKGNSKQPDEKNLEQQNDANENEILSDVKRKILQEDLAKAMLSAAQISMKSCTEKLSENSPVENQDQEESDDDPLESEEAERNSNEQESESSDEEVIENEDKIKSCYANGCCNVLSENPGKVL